MINNLHILPRKALAIGYELGAILWGAKKITSAQAQKQAKEQRSFILYKLIDTLHLTDHEIEITKIDQRLDEIDLSFSGVPIQVRYAVAFMPTGKSKKVKLSLDENGNTIENSKNRLISLVKGTERINFSLNEISLESVKKALSDLGF